MNISSGQTEDPEKDVLTGSGTDSPFKCSFLYSAQTPVSLLSLWLLRSLIQESGNKAMSSGPGRDTRAGDKPSPGLAKQPRCDVSDHSNVLCPGGTQVLGEGGFLETQVTPLNPLVKVLTASAEALNLVPEMQ